MRLFVHILKIQSNRLHSNLLKTMFIYKSQGFIIAIINNALKILKNSIKSTKKK
jgi:hypothetical protein